MKNGIVVENGEMIYYKDGLPFHAGVTEIDGDIYYIGRHGRVVTGQHVVHKEMSNSLLERGTYTFAEDGKLIEGSFIPAKKVKNKKRRSKSHGNSHRSRSKHRSKKSVIRIVTVALSVLVLLAGAFLVDRISNYNKNSAESEAEETTIYLPSFDEPVELSSKVAQMLYSHEVTMAQVVGAEPYRSFNFSYTLADTDGLLLLSESADMAGAREFVLAKSESSVDIDNLKTGTTYYYQVKVGEETYTGSFETAEGTRYIYIPGVYNTRDIGGYTTADGNKVKQGMIIRGTELDGLQEANYFLSKKNVPAVMDQFHFVFEMDLREDVAYSGEYVSAFGEDVRHRFYNAPMYGNIFSEKYKDSLKAVFSDLAKKSNYPMYMHCTYGADRTGTVVYLLQGLLGMSEEDMLREYQMTGFHLDAYADTSRMDTVIEGLEKYPGDDLPEKIEYFLINEIGVTKAQINSIRDILLED